MQCDNERIGKKEPPLEFACIIETFSMRGIFMPRKRNDSGLLPDLAAMLMNSLLGGKLEIVPDAEAEFVFPLGVDVFVLFAHAAEILETGPENLVARTPPLPADLDVDAAVVIVFLEEQEIHRRERSSAKTVRRKFRTVFGPELKMPGFRPFSRAEREIRLGVKSGRRRRFVGEPENPGFPNVIDPEMRLALGIEPNHPLVAHVGTDMVISRLELPISRPPGERQTGPEIVRVHVHVVFEVEPEMDGTFDIDLEPLGKDRAAVSITEKWSPTAERDVPNPMQVLVVIEDRAQAGFVHTGQIRRIQNAVGEKLPSPGLAP